MFAASTHPLLTLCRAITRFVAADVLFLVRQAALRYSLIKPPRTCQRSILAVISTAPRGGSGQACCRL
jgi:hypothetical protein